MACPDIENLPTSWLLILDALASGSSAWMTPENLARQIGQNESTLTDLLADLDVDGWISVWEREEGLAVMLSSWAASRLGLRLEELGGGVHYRWVEAGHPEPSFFRARNVTRSDALESLDLVFDPRPTPDEALEALDSVLWGLSTAGSREDLDAARVPFPTVLVGEGLTPWPGPSASLSRCPSCFDRALDPEEYCLCCDRWGLDNRFRLRPLPRPRHIRASAGTGDHRGQEWRTSPLAKPRPHHSEAQALRAARKARRKRRLLARYSDS